MLERAILRQHFSQMLREVRTAAAEYERLAKSTQDPGAQAELERLARGQYRHVELTERLLEIVSE